MLAYPRGFAFADEAPNLSDLRFEFNFNYFSVSTITTLGYRDITPVGQLYPAILLARLVSLHIAHSYRSDKKDV